MYLHSMFNFTHFEMVNWVKVKKLSVYTYNNVLNILQEHLNKFERILRYPKTLLDINLLSHLSTKFGYSGTFFGRNN